MTCSFVLTKSGRFVLDYDVSRRTGQTTNAIGIDLPTLFLVIKKKRFELSLDAPDSVAVHGRRHYKTVDSVSSTRESFIPSGDWRETSPPPKKKEQHRPTRLTWFLLILRTPVMTFKLFSLTFFKYRFELNSIIILRSKPKRNEPIKRQCFPKWRGTTHFLMWEIHFKKRNRVTRNSIRKNKKSDRRNEKCDKEKREKKNVTAAITTTFSA